MRLMTAIAIALVSVASADAQQAETKEYPPEATERLQHLKGAWRMESDVIGPGGEVLQTMVVYDTLDWAAPDRILRFTSHIPETGSVSYGMWFYDTVAERFYLISVNRETGDFWRLSGDLEEWIITSDPRERADGSQLLIRFHHHDIEPNSFQATMEYSIDGGTTWTERMRQRLTRLY